MKAALDTNILAYAEGVNGASRREAAVQIIASLPAGRGILPAQVLGELFNVLVRKGGRTSFEARAAILEWSDTFQIVDTTQKVILSAMDLATDHKLGIWDAVIFSAASQSGCRVLLSEDLQEGFVWGGVTVVNPFSEVTSPLLAELLTAE